MKEKTNLAPKISHFNPPSGVFQFFLMFIVFLLQNVFIKNVSMAV